MVSKDGCIFPKDSTKSVEYSSHSANDNNHKSIKENLTPIKGKEASWFTSI